MPGHPDWAGGALVTGADFVAGPNQSFTVPHNTTSVKTVGFVKPGYFIDITVSVSSASSTIPFMLVQFQWMDSSSAAILDIQNYYLPAASSGTWRTCGKGPVRGQTLKVSFTNIDPSFSMTVNWSLGENTQHIARDDWRTLDYSTAVIPTFGSYSQTPNGVALGDMGAGVVATQNNDTLPAHTTWTQLCPMYTGIVFWQFNANSAITASVRIPTALGNFPNLDSDSPIWFDTSLTDVTVELAHPRFPLYLDFSNSTAAGIGLGWFGIMVENAS